MTTFITEDSIYRDNINEVQDGEFVDGGSDGPINIQAKQLADRTKYLKTQVDALRANIGLYTNPATIAVRLDSIDAELDALDRQIGGLGDSLGPRVTALEHHVGNYTHAQTIAIRLDALTGNLGELSNYDDTAIKARVTVVEGYIGTYSSALPIAARLNDIEGDIGVYTSTLTIAARLTALEGAGGYDDTLLSGRVTGLETDVGNYNNAATIATRLDDINADIGNYTNAATIAARLDALTTSVGSMRSGLVVTAGTSIYRRCPDPLLSINEATPIAASGFSLKNSSTPVGKGGNDTVLLSSSTQDGNVTYGVIGVAYRMECFGSVNMIRDAETDSGDTYAVYKNGAVVESGVREDGNPFSVTVTGIVPGDVITAISNKPMPAGQFKVGITALPALP